VYVSAHIQALTHKVAVPSFGNSQQSADLSKNYAKIWAEMQPTTVVHQTRNVEDSLRLAKELGGEVLEKYVLVTGSLRLVGIALSILNSSTE
jgi:folylpolyglutamate synthase/dihydropteroate synthase